MTAREIDLLIEKFEAGNCTEEEALLFDQLLDVQASEMGDLYTSFLGSEKAVSTNENITQIVDIASGEIDEQLNVQKEEMGSLYNDYVAYAQNQKLSGEEADKLIQKAWSFWCNDMFWLIAPFKVNDPGVIHELIEHEEGNRLKVEYSSGGVTPGDSYVWIFDEEGKPKAYEMYVGVLPVKGMSVPWEGWKKITTGAIISTSHGAMLKMEGVQGGMQLSDVGLTEDIWAEIR